MKRVNGKSVDDNSGIENDVDSHTALIQMLIPIAKELGLINRIRC